MVDSTDTVGREIRDRIPMIASLSRLLSRWNLRLTSDSGVVAQDSGLKPPIVSGRFAASRPHRLVA